MLQFTSTGRNRPLLGVTIALAFAFTTMAAVPATSAAATTTAGNVVGNAVRCETSAFGNDVKFTSPQIYAQSGWGWTKQQVIVEAHLWILDKVHNQWLDAGRFDGVPSSGPYSLLVDQYYGGQEFGWSFIWPGVGPLPRGYTYTIGFKIWWLNGTAYTYGQYWWGSCTF
jgi:hypothetical protein